METVIKKWGYEQWIVNNEDYCAKLLNIKGGAVCSYHCHPKKRETFLVLLGHVEIMVEGESHTSAPMDEPTTIEPGQKHKFRGITDAVMLEVSMHHDDNDVERFSESTSGVV